MRLAELSARSGLPTATIKYYLRLGLLAPGRTESSTWASYDDRHLRRLALVRALTDVAGLSLDGVRQVLTAVDDESTPLHDSLGTAQWLLSPAPETQPSEDSLARVDALVERHGWTLADGGPLRARLAGQLDTLAGLDFPARTSCSTPTPPPSGRSSSSRCHASRPTTGPVRWSAWWSARCSTSR